MPVDPERLKSDRAAVEAGLAEVALRGRTLEARLQAVEWQEEFVETIARHGAARSPFPYDIEGVWRLAPNRGPNPYYALEPVMAHEELPPADGVWYNRDIRDLKDLVTGECGMCGEHSPVFGRSRAIEVGMGDVGAQTEIAVIHCDVLTVQSHETSSLSPEESRLFDFTPHQKPPELP